MNWDYVFANADFMRNKTIYLTVIGVCVLYLLLLIVARFRDKNDRDKVRHTHTDLLHLSDECCRFQMGITLLPDNHKTDRYFYQIIVFTGHRKDAGTQSKVSRFVSPLHLANEPGQQEVSTTF